MSGTVRNNAGRDSGSVSDSLDATKLTGALPAISGANLTGTIADARISESSVTQHVDLAPLLKNIKLSSLRIATLEDDAFNLMVDGVTDAFTTEAGVNTSASTNEIYNSTTNSYENLGVGATEDGGHTFVGSPGGADYSVIDVSWAINNSEDVVSMAAYCSAADTITLKIFLENSANNFDIVVNEAFSHGGTGWEEFTLSSPYTIPASGTYYAGFYTSENQYRASSAFASGWTNAVDVTGTGYSFASYSTDVWFGVRVRYKGAAVDSTLVSNSITAEAEPSTVEALVLHQPVDAVTLGTDYTMEISIDNGSNYDEITMTDVGEFSSGINILRGSVDVSARTGTTIIWRQKTLNTTEQKLHGIALGWS